MMAFKFLVLLVALSCLLANSTFPAREIPMKPGVRESKHLARIQTDASIIECWNALAEIKSCSHEIMIFIRDGKTDISHRCCEAIAFITHNCWPAMLTTALGFTVDQTYILRGYCDEEESSPISSGPAQGPSA